MEKQLFTRQLESLMNKIKIAMTNSLSFIVIYFVSKIEDGKNKKNSLICVNTERLGDLVLAADFLFSLGNYSSFSELYIVVQNKYISLFNWEKLGLLPIPLNKNKYKINFIYRIKFLLKLKRKGFSTAINFTPERGWINDELILSTKTKSKVAFNTKSRYLIKCFLNTNNERYSHLYNNDGINQYILLRNYLSEKHIQFNIPNNLFNSILPSSKIHEMLRDVNYICISPFASNVKKSWGFKNYSMLISKLMVKFKVVILGDKKELKEIKSSLEPSPNLIDYYFFSLPESVNLILNSSLFIGNDSGLTHIAHNLKVPTIAIIGGGEYGNFFPYKENPNTIYYYHKLDCFGCNWNCIYKERYCLKNIKMDDVVDGINFLLNKNIKNDKIQNGINEN